MKQTLAVTLIIIVFSGAFVSICLAIFHTYKMLHEVRNDKRFRVQLIPWAAFVFSSTLTDKGCHHRSKMLINAGIALSCFALLITFRYLVS